MPPYRDREIERLYYSISEVAEMVKVNASLIRYWEKKFDILKPKKNKKGDRLFTKEDIESIKLIYHLVKERGYKLKGAKDKINENLKNSMDKSKIIESLQKVKSFLLELKNEL